MNEVNTLPCPFCGVALVANSNPADLYVKRYGAHYTHPLEICVLSDIEISLSQVAAWNKRADTQRSLEAPPDSIQGDPTASDSQRPEAAGPTISMVPLSLALDVAVEIVKDFAPQYEQEARQIANAAFAETQRSPPPSRPNENESGRLEAPPEPKERSTALTDALAELVAVMELVDTALSSSKTYDEFRALGDEYVRRKSPAMAAARAALSHRSTEAPTLRFVALRAKGVLDADDNLDCWDTPPYDIAERHVQELRERDPLARWRVAQLYVAAEDQGIESPPPEGEPA